MRCLLALLTISAFAQPLPPNQWTGLDRNGEGGRRGSAVRYANGKFILWGYMNPDPDLPQEFPLVPIPEYDVVSFNLTARRWTNELPDAMAAEWSRRLPPGYVPRTYSGITTGSERSIMRNSSNEPSAVPRPDLNLPFDQVALRPQSNTLYYFTGGLTASYDVARRRWSDLRPVHSPPPVLGGSLAYDPLHDEFILFGGGHVAEPGPAGQPRGYTGTWAFNVAQNDWRPLRLSVQPPPRMVTRLVTDTRRNLLILFGGDGQSHYLADTWIFDLASRTWHQSKAPAGPPPRAGHFTVFDPATGLVFIGGGNNRTDLTDLWAYDPSADSWRPATGTVPTGFYITADIDTDRHTIVLLTNNRPPNDRLSCNILFPVRTTYAFPINELSLFSSTPATHRDAMPKRAPLPTPYIAPTRTWGSATFDSTHERIFYWGGGHCGYEGSDVDFYDVSSKTWIPEPTPPSYPERLWNHGVRPAGVTFRGEPWMDHGRRVYAYDPVGDRMIMAKGVLLTTGYNPAWIRHFPQSSFSPPDALVKEQSAQYRWATWDYNLKTRKWSLIAPAPAGLDTLVSTPLGVMAVNVYWRTRDNDSGYHLPWRPSDPPADNAVFLFRNNHWERISHGPSPQNLYEMTSLAFDTKRNQLILHGAGTGRKELWTFDLAAKRWTNHNPAGPAPTASREAVYLPGPDVFLTYADTGLWEYNPATNAWRKLDIPLPTARVGQNRAMVYDAKQDLILLVLGAGGDDGKAAVYPLRYHR